MKCQKCEKMATFHITELTGAKPQECHFCEEHAREYLNDSSEQGDPVGNLASTLTEGMSQQASVSKAASSALSGGKNPAALLSTLFSNDP